MVEKNICEKHKLNLLGQIPLEMLSDDEMPIAVSVEIVKKILDEIQ